jgi:TIR domain
MAGSTPAAPGRIFLSYRREETDFPAGWLHDRLAAHFGRDQVFRDVDDIPLGANFPDVIAKAVASCDVLLALIGSQWMTITDEEGKRRLDDPNDFVRLEIEAALQRDVLVIPILVRGAKMPRAGQLPGSLAELVHRNALELSSTSFDFDTGRLLEVLDETLAGERARRDAAKKARRDAEQNARRDAEQKARLQLSETEVDFGTLVHGAVPPWRTIQLQNAGTGPLNARVSTEEPWIALHLLGNMIQLRIDTAVPGRLDGEVHITSDGGDASVPVRALVRPGPILAVEPSLVDFGQVDTRARSEVLARVINTGRGELEWTHEASGSFFQTERVPEGLHLRLDVAPPGRHHGSVAVRSNGGDVTIDVRADLVSAVRVRRRRVPRSAVLAIAVALLLLGGFTLWALMPPEVRVSGSVTGSTVPDRLEVIVPGSTVPDRLEDAVADFGRGFAIDTRHSGGYSLDTLGNFHGSDADAVRPVLEGLSFRRGYARALNSDEGELLSVNVMELGSAQAARAAKQQIGACLARPEGNFKVPSIAGATGWRCNDSQGRPIQEVVFTGGPLFYRMKLHFMREPQSTDRIVELARIQARKVS